MYVLRQATPLEVQASMNLPTLEAAVLGCCAAGALLAVKETLNVVAAIDPDWKAFEYLRSKGWGGRAVLIRAPLNGNMCRRAVAEAHQNVC